jgi:formamidopyrimidine-DNA glycosylase
MFEIPETVTLAKQINTSLRGKTIIKGRLGNSPHKFVWYNLEHDEFERLTKGKIVGEARAKGRWMFVPLEPGYVLLLGECGGKMLYHEDAGSLPKKYHLWLAFDDGSYFTLTTQMWGAMELYQTGDEQERQYVKGMRPTPVEPEFTYEYFSSLIDELILGEKRSAKGLLTQDQLIPGLGNAIAQDILYRAGLHPRRPLVSLDAAGRRRLYDAIRETLNDAIAKGGRNDELDLYGRPGGYTRIMDRHAAGKPCLGCGTIVEKIQYLGGACYICPHCQPLD